MIRENYKSTLEAWCKWSDDGIFSYETSISVYKASCYYFENDVVWYIQPHNGKKMCDVDSAFGGFGVALRLALMMFRGEFND